MVIDDSLYIPLFLTLTLLEPKEIKHCHQYRARPAWTSGQSDQALYCWLTNLRFFISLKMIMESSKTWRWIIPFYKFSRLRVNVFIGYRIFGGWNALTLCTVCLKLHNNEVNNEDPWKKANHFYLPSIFFVSPVLFHWSKKCQLSCFFVPSFIGSGTDWNCKDTGMRVIIFIGKIWILLKGKSW